MDQNPPANDQFEIPQEVRQYIDDLISDSGGDNFDDETKTGLAAQIYLRLDNFLTTTLVESLPQDQLEAFAHLNESNPTQEQVEEFLRQHLTNPEQIMSQALIDFRELFLKGTAADQDNSASS